MQAPPLYILRHGQTDWNATGRMQGRLDSNLTDLGRAQAQAQHAILQTCDLTGHRAITSPQGRAFHTASIALGGLVDGIETDAALSEIGLGGWAGRSRDALLAEVPQARDAFDLYEYAPGGEGFSALRARCTAFLGTLSGPAVLVTHGITSRMLRLILLDRPTEDLRDIGGGQGVVYHIDGARQTRLE